MVPGLKPMAKCNAYEKVKKLKHVAGSLSTQWVRRIGDGWLMVITKIQSLELADLSLNTTLFLPSCLRN